MLLLHVDKLLCVALVIYVLTQVYGSIVDLTVMPKSEEMANQVIGAVDKSDPPPPKFKQPEIRKKYDSMRGWPLGDEKWDRNLFYKREKKDILKPVKEYAEKLRTHKPIFFDTKNGMKANIFPGSNLMIKGPEDYMRPCTNFKNTSVTMTSITIEWEDPRSKSERMKIAYCLVEKRVVTGSETKDDWIDVADDSGEPIKFYGGDGSQKQMMQKEQKEDPGGFVLPEHLRGGDPIAEMKKEEVKKPKLDAGDDPEVKKMIAVLSRFKLSPEEGLIVLRGKKSELKELVEETKIDVTEFNRALRTIRMAKSTAVRLLKKLMKRNQDNMMVKKEKNKYRFTDFNLEPSSEYEYRVRAVGINFDNEFFKGEYTTVLKVKTKKDIGFHFIRYVPRIIDKKGKVVSKDRVTVKISKLYDAPWKPGSKHLIFYDHKNIIPGDPVKSKVGKVVMKHRIKDGGKIKNNVLFDHREGKFLYVGDSEGTSAPVKPPKNKRHIKYFYEKVDFSSKWVAKTVDERIVTEKSVDSRINPKTGKFEQVPVEKSRYDYILILIDQKDPKVEPLELLLETKNPYRRLRFESTAKLKVNN